MQRQFRSVDEAERWADSQGVVANYGGRSDIARFCNEMIAQLLAHSLLLPDQIEVDARIFFALGRQGIQSPASANKGRIAINPDAFYWSNPTFVAGEMWRQKYWSSNDPIHPLYHEAGHVIIYKANPERFEFLRDLRPAQKTLVIDEVSQRACQDVYEFLSEVFAGLMAGRTFRSDIMRWYYARGGVKP